MGDVIRDIVDDVLAGELDGLPAYMMQFLTGDRDVGLTIDRIWVTRGTDDEKQTIKTEPTALAAGSQTKSSAKPAASLESLFNREPPRIIDNEAYGDQRDLPDLKPGWSPREGEINRAAYLVGPVMTKTVVGEGTSPDRNAANEELTFATPHGAPWRYHT